MVTNDRHENQGTPLSDRARAALTENAAAFLRVEEGSVVALIVPPESQGLETVVGKFARHLSLNRLAPMASFLSPRDAEAIWTAIAVTQASPGPGRIWVLVIVFNDEGIAECITKRAEVLVRSPFMSKGGSA